MYLGAAEAAPTTLDGISRYRAGLELLANNPLFGDDGQLLNPFTHVDEFVHHLNKQCDGLFDLTNSVFIRATEEKPAENARSKDNRVTLFGILYDLFR